MAYDAYIILLPESERDGTDAAVLASGYERVATGEKLSNVVRNTKSYQRGTQRTGPAWIRASPQSTDDTKAELIACSENRYRPYAGEAPDEDRHPFALVYAVRTTTDG